MNRLYSALLALWLALVPAAARSANPTLTPEQAARELRILKRALTELHPGLYRYQTADQLEAAFAQAAGQVADGSDAFEMYLLVTRLAASVRCGHTWTNPVNQSESLQQALAGLPALPARIRMFEGRWLVTATAEDGVNVGDEVLAIDGRTPAVLVKQWMPYLRADGGSDGKRLSQIDSTVDGGALDRLLPVLHPPKADRYQLRLQDSGGWQRTVSASAMTASERERRLQSAGQPGEGEEWRFGVDGNVATLTLPTFAFWRSSFDWRALLDHAFATLKQRHIPYLIIDLRQNEGGDQAIGDALLAHLISAPYRPPAGRVESAYERAPYELARYMDTWDFGFFDRTGLVTRGKDRNWILRDQPAEKVILPVAHPYPGRVAALTGPRMSSAGFLVARNLKASHAATLIGQPTGGSLRGLNGGELAWLTLPYSGVAVDIPLLATFVHDEQPDHGVTPDVLVRTRIQDVRLGIDPDRRAALVWLSATEQARPALAASE